MKISKKISSFVLSLMLLLNVTSVNAFAKGIDGPQRIVTHTETFKEWNTNWDRVELVDGAGFACGTLRVLIEYEWYETWIVDPYGNKLQLDHSTTPKLTKHTYSASTIPGWNYWLERESVNNDYEYTVKVKVESIKYGSAKTNTLSISPSTGVNNK